MIEVVYNKDEGENHNKSVKLPKNIRQVGVPGSNRRIYIEDYAYNYIDEYQDKGQTCIGVLLGESCKTGNERYSFIKGAMSVENAEISGENIYFTEETWNGVYNGIKKYFPEHEILGWYVIVSDFGDDILKRLKKSHMDNFAGNDKALMVVDRTENNIYFSVYENNRLVKQEGYIIYYEKNEKMQNYLVETRNGTRVEEEQNERVKGNFRKLLAQSADEQPKNKGAWISYATNAVLVVMILFVGMYMVNDHNSVKNADGSYTGQIEWRTEQSDTQQATLSLIPVVEISGNVYPVDETSEISVETGVAADNKQTDVLQAQGENIENRTQPQTEYMTQEETQAETSVIETQAATAAAGVYNYETYEIKKGENLITISKKFYGDTKMIDEIMRINDIDDRNKVYEGQIIKLP